MNISESIEKLGVVPVVVLNDANDAKPLAKALCEGGLPCAEVTFRTAAAKDSIKIMTEDEKINAAFSPVFAEDKESPYVNLIVTREENKDSDKIKKFVESYQSEEVEKVAADVFKGGAVKGW